MAAGSRNRGHDYAVIVCHSRGMHASAPLITRRAALLGILVTAATPAFAQTATKPAKTGVITERTGAESTKGFRSCSA